MKLYSDKCKKVLLEVRSFSRVERERNGLGGRVGTHVNSGRVILANLE